MVAKTARQAVRVITLLGGLLLLPATAMVGPGKGTPWAYWIWEGSLGVKLASAREPFDLGPDDNGPSSLPTKDQLIDQNNQLFAQASSDRRASESTAPRSPLGFPSEGGSERHPANPGGRDSTPLDPEKRGLELPVPWEARATNPANRRGPGVGNRAPEASPLFGGTNCQTVSSVRAVSPSQLLPWQKDCHQLGRYLEQLGATEYSVHPWEPAGGVYRAWCRVKVLPNGSLWTRHFEATGQTAAEAMLKVAEQVLQWRERNIDGGQFP